MYEDFRMLNKRLISKRLFLWLLCLFIIAEIRGQSGQVHAQGPYTDGQDAYLTSSDINKLRALKAPIAVPTYIPIGFKLENIICEGEELGDFWSVEYVLKYSNGKGSFFEIRSINELGDPFVVPVLRGKNPFFGGTIKVGHRDPSLLDTRRHEIGSDWIFSKRRYVPPGARSIGQGYRLAGEGLSIREALKIMVSLRYMR